LRTSEAVIVPAAVGEDALVIGVIGGWVAVVLDIRVVSGRRQVEDAAKVLQLLAEHDLNQVPVVEDGKVVGMLNRSDMIRYIQARKELGLGRRRGR